MKHFLSLFRLSTFTSPFISLAPFPTLISCCFFLYNTYKIRLFLIIPAAQTYCLFGIISLPDYHGLPSSLIFHIISYTAADTLCLSSFCLSGFPALSLLCSPVPGFSTGIIQIYPFLFDTQGFCVSSQFTSIMDFPQSLLWPSWLAKQMSLEAFSSLEEIWVLKSGVSPVSFIYKDYTKTCLTEPRRKQTKGDFFLLEQFHDFFSQHFTPQKIILDKLCLFVCLFWGSGSQCLFEEWLVFLSSVLFFPPQCPAHTYIFPKAAFPQILCQHEHHKGIGFDACPLQEVFYRFGHLAAKCLTSHYLTDLIGCWF